MSSLTDTLISDTFDSLIHSNGSPLPVSGLINLYDGAGSKSSLSIGRESNGITVSGKITSDTLTVGSVNYPTSNGTIGNILYQQTATQWGYLSQIPTNSIADLSPSPANNYRNPITGIAVNAKGMITGISDISTYGATGNTTPHGSPSVGVTGSPIELLSINEWVKIDLTNDGAGTGTLASILDSTKAITGFLRSVGVVDHGGKGTFIQATFDTATDGPKFPVLYDIPVNSSDKRGLGNSFYCPVIRETSGGVERGYIYLRNTGGPGDTSVNTTTWILTITAQHI